MRRVLFLVMLLSTGCENWLTRNYGGHMTVRLPPCHRLVVATWKEADLWYLTELMGANTPRTSVFRESSLYNAFEGSVTFLESCPKTEE